MNDLRVGISSCLLGNHVRYDGRHKLLKELENSFPASVELIPFCPEVASGLGIPRPPIQLSDSLTHPKACLKDNPGKCFTAQLREFAWKVANEYELHGFIFKSRSPSCGLNSAPVSIDGQVQDQMVSGIFAAALLEHLPYLPAIDETFITSGNDLDQFLDLCHSYRQCGPAGF